MDAIGQKLKQAREAKKLSQEEAAGLAKMATRTLSRLESGEGNPTLSTLLALAQVYGVTIDALTGRSQFAKGHLAEAIARQAVWDEAARVLVAIGQASKLRRLIALYILSKDSSYLEEIRQLPGTAQVVQFLRSVP